MALVTLQSNIDRKPYNISQITAIVDNIVCIYSDESM